MQKSFRFAALLAALPLFAWCQSGHWEGQMKVPQGAPMKIAVDLAKGSDGKWVGTMGMPEMGINDTTLSQVVVAGTLVRFIQEVPGRPSFAGNLSANGKQLDGHMTTGGVNMSLTMNRTGEPNVKLAAASTAVSKTLEGTWNATVEQSGGVNHLVLKVTRDAKGLGAGTLTNLESKTESPLSSISQVGDFVTFEIRALVGSYRGSMNKLGTTITGEWMQNGASRPLIFTRQVNATTSKVAPNVLGTWISKIDMGEEYKLDLILKFSKSNTGATIGALRIADATSKEMVVTNIVQRDRTISFDVGELKVTFRGTLNDSSTGLRGLWDQMPLVHNLDLTFTKK